MDSLRERREAVVREHMESENRHEFDVALVTFHHPRYEIIATGEVHDGPDEVMRYFVPPGFSSVVPAAHGVVSYVILSVDHVSTPGTKGSSGRTWYCPRQSRTSGKFTGAASTRTRS